ncbi:hypothetical protein F5Y08DRAFT_116823 [Xylaria arbuscula]|nr:hypothetical protein F5Y08DRAFT_116823 [Xylaria arbuscula]
MGVTDGFLGPVLGGVLAFVGAIVAALLSFTLTRRNRTRRFDEEYANSPSHELVRMPNLDGANDLHHGSRRLVEYWRSMEVNVVRARGV